MTQIPSPNELAQKLPLTPDIQTTVAKMRSKLQNIIDRTDNRLLIIAGPCSVHDYDSAIEYAEKLAELSNQVSDTCLLMMRVYVEKARTRHGWTGLVYDPSLDGSYDLEKGLYTARKLFVELAKRNVPVATELLNPLVYPYLCDLITWGCIGARTVTSQPHRQLASGAPFPVGFKNNIDGNIDVAIDGVLAARKSHTFFGAHTSGSIAKIKTVGNPRTHLVLRGARDSTNYDLCTLRNIQEALDRQDVDCRILIDCSHGNCQGFEEEQKEVFLNTLENIADGTCDVMGLMLESHLEKGKQRYLGTKSHPSRSITDPCIDWQDTTSLILWAHKALAQGRDPTLQVQSDQPKAVVARNE